MPFLVGQRQTSHAVLCKWKRCGVGWDDKFIFCRRLSTANRSGQLCGITCPAVFNDGIETKFKVGGFVYHLAMRLPASLAFANTSYNRHVLLYHCGRESV